MPHPPQPLASLQQIYASRSKRDGIPSEVEQDLRVVGCMLIQEVGILLELHDTAIAALYLSTKLCETPVRLEELLNVYLVVVHRNRHIRHSRAFESSLSASAPGTAGAAAPGNSTSTDTNTSHQAQPHSLPLPSFSNNTLETPIGTIVADFVYQPPPGHASIWWTMKDAICTGEMQILKRLGFNMQPYSKLLQDTGLGRASGGRTALLGDPKRCTPNTNLHAPPTPDNRVREHLPRLSTETDPPAGQLVGVV
ncbi:hypothetical protein QFC21_006282 [Naganishia friedmannii]|uniref:Uncharacterized protein n=1 Tax=Naganishia friedmannii TaxID=89922 RepID=A0ACC2V4W4_9TREE|nr:hypothetical protein QFC21_006282 [Naganishia friedmannii]